MHNFTIVSDIDGVLITGKTALAHSANALKQIKRAGVPLVLLTNNGICTEEEKTNELKKMLDLDEQSLNPKQMNLCHSFMGSDKFLKQYQGKTVVLTSYDEDKSLELARHYGFDEGGVRYLNSVELACIYHPGICEHLSCMPEFRDVYGDKGGIQKLVEKYQQQVLTRFGTSSIEDLRQNLQISAMIDLCWTRNYTVVKQLICDLVASKDGYLDKSDNIRSKDDPQFVEYVTCSPDTQYTVGPGSFPRIGAGMFNLALKALFKQLYKYDMQVTEYGKPNAATYEFIETKIQAENKTCYMIGDNLRTDIQGANARAGKSENKWVSIAVKTGVFQGTPEEMESSGIRPDHIVHNFDEAVKLIFQIEGIEM